MTFENNLTCLKCNRQVEIVSITRISDNEEQENFSCGHSRKRVKRTMTDSISMSDSISTQGKKPFYKVKRILDFFKKS